MKDDYLKIFYKSFSMEVTKTTKKPLRLIYVDICNPIHPNSLVRTNIYILLFIDDFSRKLGFNF